VSETYSEDRLEHGLTRFIRRGFETAVPRRVGDAVFGGVDDAGRWGFEVEPKGSICGSRRVG
jgi:hypothetical protein